MKRRKGRCCRLLMQAFFILSLLNLLPLAATDVEARSRLAFPEKFIIRLSSYSVKDADTDLTVLSSSSIGTGFSFVEDLGGEDSATIPRIDGYYRFNSSHRIEFGTFRIQRDGRNRLGIDLDIGDETYSVGDTVISGIDYELIKIGYAFSFYHSPEVELSVTAGLNGMAYEFDYELVDGSSEDTSKSSGPLPMFGVRMSYAFNSRWSIHYFSEVLFVETGDTRGSIQSYEVDLRYKLKKSFILGVGLIRFGVDITTDDREWNGRIADTHQGLLVSGSYFFN